MSKQQGWENDNFEDFIRRSVDDQPIDFDPKAWEAMEQKLDAYMPVAGKARGKGGRMAGLIALLLISSFTGWYLISGRSNQLEQESPATAQQIVKEKDQDYAATKVLAEPNINKEQEATPQHNTIEGEKKDKNLVTGAAEVDFSKSNAGDKISSATREAGQAGYEKSSTQEAKQAAELHSSTDPVPAVGLNNQKKDIKTSQAPPLRESQLISAGVQMKRADDQAQPEAIQALPADVQKGNEVVEGAPTRVHTDAATVEERTDILNDFDKPELAFDKGSVVERAAVKTDNSINTHDKQLQLLAEKQQHNAVLLPTIQKLGWIPAGSFSKNMIAVAITAKPMNEAEKAEEGNVIAPKATTFPLSVSVTVAPDFTGAGQAGSTKFGAGAGLHLEYSFLKRFSLVTGAFYSKKNYLVDNSFSPYGKSWGGKYEPDYIDASCGVIDIPINLRYYFWPEQKHQFFVSAGASSYIMKSEDYEMVYNYGGYPKSYTYSVRGENSHFMAVYNLSLGYEYLVSQRWSLQAEPFLKIPAKGVGSGSAKLGSMGAFVHLKYKIVR